ncbi:MAG: hypothetical protein CMI85_05445 [Candidatus Pelagibacter sp.]|nr:hypothetical protein [Candidatus Pelagibacter sp.]
MNKIFITVIILYFFTSLVHANQYSKYYNLGIKYYNNNNLEIAKFNFEKDIVRNTKNLNSYLYLAKIFKKKNNRDEFEKNLKTVLLLDPKNEEALYFIIIKKYKDGDYNYAEEKFNIFKKSCVKLCKKKLELSELINKPKS